MNWTEATKEQLCKCKGKRNRQNCRIKKLLLLTSVFLFCRRYKIEVKRAHIKLLTLSGEHVVHHQQQFSCINSRQRYFTILTPPRRSSVMYTHREYICCHRILPKWMLYWLRVENGTYSQLLISMLCHHLLWTSTTTWGSCAVQWTHQKIKDRFGHPFFFIGSPTHRKLLLKNKKSFALVNGSPEAKLHVDSWGQNLAKIWTHVLLAIQRGWGKRTF